MSPSPSRTEFIALLALLFATIALSIDAMLPALPQIVAPAWADDDGDESGEGREVEGREVEGPLKEVHETLANLMLVLAALHVGGVVLASVRHRENLARAMITGEKRAAEPGDIA